MSNFVYPKLMRAVCIVLNERGLSVKTQHYICQRVFNLPDMTMSHFYDWRSNNGIKFQNRWTDEVKNFIREQIKTHTVREVAEMVKAEFNWPEMTATVVKGALTRYGIKTGRTGCFEKGMTAWNKGKTMSDETRAKCARTWFPKGHQPVQTRPVGSIRVDQDGRVLQKVGNQDWRAVHVMEWEKAHGPVPDGYCVICLDGNRANTSLDNLALISRREHAVMIHSKLRFADPKLTETGVRIARLKLAVTEKQKRKSKKCI